MSDEQKRRISVQHYGPKRVPEDPDHSSYVEIMIGEEEWAGQGYQGKEWCQQSHSRVLGLDSDEEVLKLIQALWEAISDEVDFDMDLERFVIHRGRRIVPRFQPGVRVIYEERADRYSPAPVNQHRWGTVVSIDRELEMNEHLRVLFDDGEEIQINQDVMRTARNSDVDPKEVISDGEDTED